MEREGYFREARERYEAAVELAMKNIDNLSIRDPENRGRAGEAHRAAGTAFFDLARFWDRRLAGHQLRLDLYRSALDHLESLGQKNLMDAFRITNARASLQILHFEEAQHWAMMGDAYRSGKNYEAAGDFTTQADTRLKLWGKAAEAYAKTEPARLEDFGRVIQKINRSKSP